MYSKPVVIAEAGCNHMGQMEIAHEMIITAAMFCKADAIKFGSITNFVGFRIPFITPSAHVK